MENKAIDILQERLRNSTYVHHVTHEVGRSNILHAVACIEELREGTRTEKQRADENHVFLLDRDNTIRQLKERLEKAEAILREVSENECKCAGYSNHSSCCSPADRLAEDAQEYFLKYAPDKETGDGTM